MDRGGVHGAGRLTSMDPAAAGPFSLVLKEGKGKGQKEMKEPWLPSWGSLINVKSSFEEPINTERQCTTETGRRLGLPRTRGVGGWGKQRSHY